MVIDIEHKLKTMLLCKVTNNNEDDGYTIVKEFMKQKSTCQIDIENACKNKNNYTYALEEKIYNRVTQNKYFIKNKDISDCFELLKIVTIHFKEIA